jgi:hypothetical protein
LLAQYTVQEGRRFTTEGRICNKEIRRKNRVCLKYFSPTINQKWVSKNAEPTNMKGRSVERDNIKVSSRKRKKKGHNWICLV